MNPYGVDTTKYNLDRPLISLNVLYSGMPGTTGCENCQSINKDNAIWCCSIVNPSMYYIEFLNVWTEVQKWNKPIKVQLIVRSIKNYLSNNDSKGCIFYQDKCLCYKQRPLQCRLYGVVPESTWAKRIESIKRIYDWENMSDAFGRKMTQCDLVSCTDGRKSVTEAEEQKWFDHTVKCERNIGVPDNVIAEYDGPKGSYRTFHDHIMLEFFDTGALNMLTKVKASMPSDENIGKFADMLIQNLEKKKNL